MDKIIYIVMNITVNVKKGQIARVPMGAPARLLKGVLTFPSSSGWPPSGDDTRIPRYILESSDQLPTAPAYFTFQSPPAPPTPLLHTEPTRLPSQITHL